MTPDQFQAERQKQIRETFARLGTISGTARELKAHKKTVRKALAAAEPAAPPAAPSFSIAPLPSGDVPVEELIRSKVERFSRKREAEQARDRIVVKINEAGPVGILHLGDPHVDDDGCDLEKLLADVEIVMNTPGLYAGILGDMTNNWVGRLTSLYANQTTTQRDGFRIARHIIERLKSKLIYMIGGNHDLWSGATDPLEWFMHQAPGVYEPARVALRFEFPKGQPILARLHHQFPGNSMWNPAHSVGRAAQTGYDDHLLMQGHIHKSGYMVVKQPTGRITHCLQVGAYKYFDAYARDKGFRDHQISPSVLTVIDPMASEEAGLVTVFTNTQHGAQFLSMLRGLK